MNMKKRRIIRNTAVATLIKYYVDKKSGKVSDSRKEIKIRFWALDWEDQKRILAAFLEGSKADRLWAYSQLLDYWDCSFEAKVKELWEQYHEERCKWVVIRFLPLDYVRQNMEFFTEERDYYFACLRLAKDKDFVIDKEKLTLTDYLAVLCHTGRGVGEQEGLDILFQIVHDYCVNGIGEYDIRRLNVDYGGGQVSPIRLRKVNRAIYYLECSDCCKPVMEFEVWSEQVKTTMIASEEYKKLHGHHFVDYDYDRRKMDILRKYAYLALDDKYKKPSDPSVDDILKSVEAYAIDDRTYNDLFYEDQIFGSIPRNNGTDEILPF